MTRAALQEEWGAPTHPHDCAHCTFLGRTRYHGQVWDLYVCSACQLRVTLAARWGDAPGELLLDVVFLDNPYVARTGHPLAVALGRAFLWLEAGEDG